MCKDKEPGIVRNTLKLSSLLGSFKLSCTSVHLSPGSWFVQIHMDWAPDIGTYVQAYTTGLMFNFYKFL